MHLYIIGNGFDLNHGLPTSYQDYRNFLLMYYPRVTRDFESCEYLTDGLLAMNRWSELERALGISYEEYMQMALDNFYPDMMSESPGWDDIRIEIQNEFDYIQPLTGVCLEEWISNIDVGTAALTRFTSLNGPWMRWTRFEGIAGALHTKKPTNWHRTVHRSPAAPKQMTRPLQRFKLPEEKPPKSSALPILWARHRKTLQRISESVLV